VVVTVDPNNVSALTWRVVILSLKLKVELAFSSSLTSQCRNCWRYGHAHQPCPATHPTCPICALHHTRAAHRCQNPTCPRGRNHKPDPSCCPTSPPHCCNCGNDHTATFRKCPAQPVPAVPFRTNSPAPTLGVQDRMDLAGDGGPTSTTPPPGESPLEVDLLTPRQQPQLDPRGVPPPLTASAVLSPWRNRALLLLLAIGGFVPVMNNQPTPPSGGKEPAPPPTFLSIIQHNCLGSWDVFLSLFESFRGATTYPSIVLLQDPPVNKAHLPSFGGFKFVFSPG